MFDTNQEYNLKLGGRFWIQYIFYLPVFYFPEFGENKKISVDYIFAKVFCYLKVVLGLLYWWAYFTGHVCFAALASIQHLRTAPDELFAQ